MSVIILAADHNGVEKKKNKNILNSSGFNCVDSALHL